MDEPLHPSSLSEILDRTAQFYRARFLVFLGIASLPIALLLAYAAGIAVFASWAGTGGEQKDVSPTAMAIGFLILGGIGLIALILFIAVTALASAAMNHAASRAFLGQSFTMREAYKAAWRRGWGAIGLYAVETIAIWVLPFAAWFVLVLLSAGILALLATLGIGGGGLLFLVEFLVVAGLVVYGFWMAVQLSLAFPAFVVEQSGAWAAMRRSFALAKGTRGRILILYLLCAALGWILSIALMFPGLIIMALIPGANSPQHAQTFGIIMALLIYGSGFAVQAITRPVYGIALMLFYFDQRIRKEGFDIEWMMLKAGLFVPANAPPQLEPASAADSVPATLPTPPPESTRQIEQIEQAESAQSTESAEITALGETS